MKAKYLSIILFLSLMSCTSHISSMSCTSHISSSNPTTSEETSLSQCSHQLIYHEEKDPTCVIDGNIAYYQCSLCNNYYLDEGAKNLTSKEDIIKEALGHNYVDGICSRCFQRMPSSGLSLSLSSDEQYYIVSGRGTNKDNRIVIPSEYNNLPVKEIYMLSFAYDETLTEIVIPSSIITIGDMAFSSCYKLKNIIFDGSPEYMNPSAFSGCTSIEKIEMEGSGKYRCENNCLIENETQTIIQGSINSMIPSSCKIIGKNSFSFLNIEGSINLPSSITMIEEYAFSRCEKLESISIPNVIEIKKGAFSSCTSLKECDMPSMEVIGTDAFRGCESLTTLTLPLSLKEINNAFAFCNISKVNYLGSIEQYLQIESFPSSYPLYASKATLYLNDEPLPSNLVIPEGITSIPNYAFSNQINLLSLSLPSSLNDIGYYSFEGCRSLIYVSNNSSLTNLESIFSNVHLIDKNPEDTIEISILDNGFITYLDKVSNLTYIAGNINKDLEELIFPQDINGQTYIIKKRSFSESNYRKVTIPSSCIEIQKEAFYNSNIEELTIDGVKEIKDYAFYGSGQLTNLTLNEGIETIGKRAFMMDNFSLAQGYYESLIIPDSVISIGDEAFYRNEFLKNITINNVNSNLKSIGIRAFSNCERLESVEFKTISSWYISEDENFEAYKEIDISNKENNATLLKSQYDDYYWTSSISDEIWY